MNKNTKLLLMAGGAVALTYALMEYYKKNVKGDATGTPTVPETDPMRASSFTAGDDFFANYVSDDFFGFTANEPFMNGNGKGIGGSPVKANAGPNVEYGDIKDTTGEVKLYQRPTFIPTKKNTLGKKQKGSNKNIGLNFTAGENFFNASGVPIATDESNFKF